MGNQPMVLIARLDDARTLYVVERESCGLYVLCQIGSWVNIKELRNAAVASKQEFPRTSEGPNNFFHAESLPAVIPEVKFNKPKRLAIEAIQSKVKRPTTTLLAESQSMPLEQATTIVTTAAEELAKEPVAEDILPPNASEIFETLRTEYFKILYLQGASHGHCYLYIGTNSSSLPWRCSQRIRSHEPGLRFTSTSIQPLIRRTSSLSSKVLSCQVH